MTSRTVVHATVLACFTMGVAVVLAAFNTLTSKDIARRAGEDLQASLEQVIPPAIHDNDLTGDVLRLTDGGRTVVVYRARKDGQPTAFAYEAAATGYAGEVRLIMGVDTTGRLLGVRVVSHHETPGLGDRIEAEKTGWIGRFAGLSLGDPPEEKWAVKKDGGQFDQFSGATITPRAVVGAIRQGLRFFAARRAEMMETNG